MDIFEHLAAGTTAANAQIALLALMAGISQDCWSAAWMEGNEFALWNVAAGAQYGQGEVSARQATLLKLLAEEAGGWWLVGLW